MAQRLDHRDLWAALRACADTAAMDDHDFWAALRACADTAAMAQRLDHRDLYKRAVWAEMADVPTALLERPHEDVRADERAIADEADVAIDDVILDVPARPELTESTSRVVVNGEVRSLGDQSTLVSALRAVQHDQWRLGVYAPPDVAERVGHAASRVLGLDIDGTLVSDARPGVHATLDDFGSQP
jgi:HD superfamily phosphohydrolase